MPSNAPLSILALERTGAANLSEFVRFVRDAAGNDDFGSYAAG